MGTDGMDIPRLAAADRSKTNGTVGCTIPFTAGPGVMARTSAARGRSGRKNRHRHVTDGRHAARGRILGCRASDLPTDRRRLEKISKARLAPQFHPLASLGVGRRHRGARCVVFCGCGHERGAQLRLAPETASSRPSSVRFLRRRIGCLVPPAPRAESVAQTADLGFPGAFAVPLS